MILNRATSFMKALALRRRADLPAGWRPIFERLVERLCTLERMPGLVVVTARSGSLYMRLSTPDPLAQAMIDQAAGESCRTCDVCGDEGAACRIDGDRAVRCAGHGHPGEEPVPHQPTPCIHQPRSPVAGSTPSPRRNSQ